MTLTDYRNFDLLITRSGDKYKAIVVDAPAGDASALFDLPFAADEFTHLSGLARGVSRHIGAAEDAGPAAALVDLGQRLFDAVFRDRVGAGLTASLSSAAQEGVGLRLRLRFEEDAASLAALPWELLYDPAQAHFIGLGESSPILRYLALPRSRSALLVEPPLRVLAVLASPKDLPDLEVEGEWQAIQDALAGLTADGKFVLERLSAPTLAGLQFSADTGAILTYGDDGSIRLWSSDGQPLHVLDGHPGGVKFAAFNQAGTLILAESKEGPARLWDIDGNLIGVLGENAAWVDVAAFDPAGENIMTVECNAVNEGDWCIRHSVNLWDSRGELITTVDDHWVEWAAFHPDGRQIATAGCDVFEPPTNTSCLLGSVWFWQAYPDVDALLAEAAQRAGRSLTSAECQQYLGQEQCP